MNREQMRCYRVMIGSIMGEWWLARFDESGVRERFMDTWRDQHVIDEWTEIMALHEEGARERARARYQDLRLYIASTPGKTRIAS